jgi:kynurenine formamidase
VADDPRIGALDRLATCTVVDLTQPLDPSTAMWPGSDPPALTPETSIVEDGSFSRRISFSEHTGTHVDAPAHFVAGGLTVDALVVRRLVLPVAMIDISARCGDDPATELLVDEILADERRHGPIEPGAAILLRTGWDRYVRAPGLYVGPDGTTAMPGYGAEAARLLVEERDVACLGIDTVGIDPGFAADFPVHSAVSLPRGVFHLEGLVGLERLPPRGAWIVIGALPLTGGSGSPARVLALVP